MDTITKLDEHSLEFAQTLQTENDFQNFVDSHPEIERSMDLRNNFYHVDRRFYNLKRDGKISKDFSIKYKIQLYNWSDYNTEMDFQRFIDENNIESPSVIYKKYSGLAKKADRLGIKLGNFNYSKVKAKIRLCWCEYNTKEDIQKFINEKGIETPSEFCKLYGGLVSRAIRFLGISLKEFKFPNKKYVDYSNYITKEDFQNFIDINDIKSPTDFKRKFRKIYDRMNRLRLHKQIVYPEPARRSLLEIMVAEKLDELGIDYSEQETFPDLKDKALLKVDFLIESKKLILEPGGIQHLVPCGFINDDGFKILQKHDKMKRDYFKDKGYTILYLFKNDHPNLFSDEEFNQLINEYPGECYRVDDIDKFFNRILSL